MLYVIIRRLKTSEKSPGKHSQVDVAKIMSGILLSMVNKTTCNFASVSSTRKTEVHKREQNSGQVNQGWPH